MGRRDRRRRSRRGRSDCCARLRQRDGGPAECLDQGGHGVRVRAPMIVRLCAFSAVAVAALLANTGASVNVSGSKERTLRVCADPNNLPFSNERREGFENRLADLVASELHAKVAYTWWAQRRGFVRNTIRNGVCDVLMGVPKEFE